MRAGREGSLRPSLMSKRAGSIASLFLSRSLLSASSLFGRRSTIQARTRMFRQSRAAIVSSQLFCPAGGGRPTAGGADRGIGVSGLNRRDQLSLICSLVALRNFSNSLSRVKSSRLARRLLLASTGRSQSLRAAWRICAQVSCW